MLISFYCCLGLSMRKNTENLKSNWKMHGSTPEQNWSVLYLPFNTNVQLDKCFILKKEEVHTLKMRFTAVHWCTCGKVLDFHQGNVSCNSYDAIKHIVAAFNICEQTFSYLTSIKSKFQYFIWRWKPCVLISNSTQNWVCMTKNKHRFHIKDTSFILYF